MPAYSISFIPIHTLVSHILFHYVRMHVYDGIRIVLLSSAAEGAGR